MTKASSKPQTSSRVTESRALVYPRPKAFSGAIGSRAGLGLAVLVYALFCAGLLVHSVYMGIAAAVAPGLALLFVQAQTISTAFVSRRATVAWLALVVAACPWQTLAVTAYGEVQTGSAADAAKLILTGMACALAFLVRVPRLRYSWPVKALLGYALVTALGALAGADPSSSLQRAVRFIIVILAVVWITSRLPRAYLGRLFVQLSLAISVIALMGRAVGLSPLGQEGRLAGYLPPLPPNVLGILAAAGLLCAAALLARRELTVRMFALVAPVLGVVLLLTQSRTSMVGLLVGLLALAGPRLTTRGPLIVGLIAFALVVAGLVQTTTNSRPLTSLLTHNGKTTTTASLGSRTSEWKAVLQLNNTNLKQAVGQGLAAKSVEVNLSSTRYAPVDGSWPAAYLSAGLVGVLLLASAVIAFVRMAIREHDDLALAIIAFLVVNSLAADVFNDITVVLILLLSVGGYNFAAGQRTRDDSLRLGTRDGSLRLARNEGKVNEPIAAS
jgi:hypothetical protein